ncbi:MAG: PQQ-dependent sugar dehydrogenase [Dehalococcoidia bacterium]|nr:PQQ-dependent sugar dehydrogenase [Dehalococcoidia bacterium]
MRPSLVAALVPLLLLLATACADPGVRLAPALAGTTFDQPVEVSAYPGGGTFVAEQGGAIWLVDDDGSKAPLLDLTALVDDELGEGLLSVALDPAFDANGHLWAWYFAADKPPRTTLARFEVVEGKADPASAHVVLEALQPGYNQNGGAIRFGPDGMLYLSIGDGSASLDPFEQGQDTSTLLATVLRIDVSASTEAHPYAVPTDNPFVGRDGVLPEIFAYGFRNPFRMDIDPESGNVWLGDVGASSTEEVNRVLAGGNYGWSIVEGARCLDAGDCDTSGLVPPVATYEHTEGVCAVIGGVVYRGDVLDHLHGQYLFADFCSGQVFALDTDEDDATPEVIATLDGAPVTFGRDSDGAVLIADYAGGGIYRLEAE